MSSCSFCMRSSAAEARAGVKLGAGLLTDGPARDEALASGRLEAELLDADAGRL